MLAKIKNLFGAQDMTVGNPTTNIAKFAIPLLIGNLAQQLYSTVDSIVVGKYCSVETNGYTGVDALAAVGVSGPIINLLLVLFIAISTGAGILVAQYFGAKDKERLSHCIGTSVWLIVITSIIITVVGIPLTDPLLKLINTPAIYFDIASVYLKIILAGIVGGGIYNIISGILRGMGDSFYPLVFLIVAALLNIVLDLVFVIYFGWGVMGVALATIMAQGVSAVLCLIRLNKMKDVIVLNRKSLTPNGHICAQTLKLGLPSGVTQAVFSLAMVFVQSLTNQMGDFVPAISVAVMRVDGFAMMPNFTFGLAISTYIGQNIGAGRHDRIKPGEYACLKLALIVSALLVLCLVLWGGNLINVFINADTTSPDIYEKVVSIGARALRILAVGYVAMAITQVYGGILRAAGDTMSTMFISIFTSVAIRVPLAYLLAYFTRNETWPHGHPDTLFISMLISWVLGALLTYLRYRQGKWKDIKLV